MMFRKAHFKDYFATGSTIFIGSTRLQYQLTPRLQGVWSIIPGIPYVITQSLGVRWLF